ncbi:MAG: enoyl-CoA hydratase family protein [Segniliparus sp.]|uniref:enoyl-CoA hydratase family protein n=1 Tax=Segniliparus sp. TaxID=2804064 RepID=UPI003F355DC8
MAAIDGQNHDSATGEQPLIDVVRSRGFVTITLDSPHNRNALGLPLIAQLKAALKAAGDDPSVRGVVLTHRDGAFSAGADLTRATKVGESSTEDDSAVVQLASLFRTILELPKPVVSAIDGATRGGGVALAAASDIVIAGPNAHFGMPEVRLGFVPTTVSLVILPRVDNRAISRYYLTGESFDSQEAKRIGLVTIATDDVAGELERVKENLIKGSPQGHHEVKKLVNQRFLDNFDKLPELAELSLRLITTPEVQEGLTAFFQKRQPSWAVVSD